jgi:hypothetical protein
MTLMASIDRERDALADPLNRNQRRTEFCAGAFFLRSGHFVAPTS